MTDLRALAQRLVTDLWNIRSIDAKEACILVALEALVADVRSTESTPSESAGPLDLDALVTPMTAIIQRVAELSDRTSPSGHSSGLVTTEELRQILTEELSPLIARLRAAEQSVETFKTAVALNRHAGDEFQRAITQGAREQRSLEKRVVALQDEGAAKDAEIGAAWDYIRNGYDIEPREYFEREAPKNGFRYALAQAMHHIWKRNPKVEAVLAAKDAEMALFHDAMRESDWKASCDGCPYCGPLVMCPAHSRLSEKDAEIARLTQERNEARDGGARLHSAILTKDTAEQRVTALEADLARVRDENLALRQREARA